MIRYVPLILVLVLTIYSMIDCLQAGADEVRSAPKWAWLLLILFFPVVGALAYLVAGRPLAGYVRPVRPPDSRGSSRRRAVPLSPDDDPEFLASLRDLNSSHEKVLDEWEADLRRREQELRDKEQRDRTDDDPDAR